MIPTKDRGGDGKFLEGNTLTPEKNEISRVHSYAKYFLHINGIEIYHDGKRILEPDNIFKSILKGERAPLKHWRTPKLEPYIETFSFEDKKVGEHIREITIDELARLGIGIYSRGLKTKKRAFLQRVEYYLGSIKSNFMPKTSAPQGSRIEYDEPNNSVRLAGSRETDWLVLGKVNTNPIDFNSLSFKEALAYTKTNADFSTFKRNRRVDIPENEIIVGISYSKRVLVCIEKQKDIPLFGIVGKMGEGKCLVGGTKVLMSNGTWKNIEEIKIGDELLSPINTNGTVHSKVIETTTYLSEDNYIFYDKKGNKLFECSGNHQVPIRIGLWNKKLNKYSLRRIDIQAKDLYKKSKIWFKNRGAKLIQGVDIPNFKHGKQCPHCNNYLDPEINSYTIGVWLGDGSFTNGNLNITSANEGIMNEVTMHYPTRCSPSIRKSKDPLYSRISKAKTYSFSVNGKLGIALRDLGLENKRSHDKFIPQKLLLTSKEFRLSLLAGIFDTDGYIDTYGGRMSITTKSWQLANDLVFLIRSLDGNATIRGIHKKCHNSPTQKVGKYYHINFNLKDSTILPLKNKFKKDRLKVKGKRGLTGYILFNIKKSSESKPVYGITIDSQSKYFIIDNFIITHNSLIFHSLGCQFTYRWHFPWCHLYDYKCETPPWVLPAGLNEDMRECDKLFMCMLNKVNLSPMPMPLVWVYPTMAYPQNKPNQEEGINLDMSLSFKDFIDNYEIITKGDANLGFEASTFHMDSETLSSKRSLEEIYNYIENEMIEDVDLRKQYKMMLLRLKRLMTFVFKKNFLDISSGISSELRVVKKYEDGSIAYDRTLPMIPALMMAGVNPILVTQKLEKIRMGQIDLTSSYINFLVQQIYDIKREHEVFRHNYIYIMIDEMGKLTRSGAIKPLIDASTMGRGDGIGFCYANQNWKEIPHHIKEQTDYLFAMRTGDKTEYKEICSDFGDDKSYAEDIGNLNTKRTPYNYVYECYVFHRKPLVTYSLDTGKRDIITKDPIRITFLPPMSKHAEPMEGR